MKPAVNILVSHVPAFHPPADADTHGVMGQHFPAYWTCSCCEIGVRFSNLEQWGEHVATALDPVLDLQLQTALVVELQGLKLDMIRVDARLRRILQALLEDGSARRTLIRAGKQRPAYEGLPELSDRRTACS